MTHLRRSLVILVALASIAPTSAARAGSDITAGFTVELSTTPMYSPGTPIPLSGRLLVAVGLPVIVEVSRGVREQQVELFADEVPAGTATTNEEGSFHFDDVRFDGRPPYTHVLRAVFARGTPLETSSRSVTVTSDRIITDLEIRPSPLVVGVGSTLGARAWVSYDDGRDPSDVTADVVWMTADPAVATISNEEGSKGSITGVAPGTTSVTATLHGVSTSTPLTVS
jgi:hypothetical protein